MQSRQSTFVFSAATLLVTLTAQSVLAFSLNGATQGSGTERDLLENFGFDFKVIVETDNVRPTPQNELNELLEFLNGTTFSSRFEFREGSELSGTFNIRNNTPCDPEITCINRQGGVGAIFDLTFTPSDSDPELSRNLYWIQWVSADFSGRYPNYEFIDIYLRPPLRRDPNTLSPHPTPYYVGTTRLIQDAMGNPSSFYFLDRPYIQNFAYNHDWDFQLYLAEQKLRRDEETGRIYREVTVHNGISWGWTNTRINPDDNGSGGTGGGGIGDGSTGGGGTTSSLKDREVPLFENDDDEAAEDPEKIPEATSLLGLFALSSWGIFQWLKNRKHK